MTDAQQFSPAARAQGARLARLGVTAALNGNESALADALNEADREVLLTTILHLTGLLIGIMEPLAETRDMTVDELWGRFAIRGAGMSEE